MRRAVKRTVKHTVKHSTKCCNLQWFWVFCRSKGCRIQKSPIFFFPQARNVVNYRVSCCVSLCVFYCVFHCVFHYAFHCAFHTVRFIVRFTLCVSLCVSLRFIAPPMNAYSSFSVCCKVGWKGSSNAFRRA